MRIKWTQPVLLLTLLTLVLPLLPVQTAEAASVPTKLKVKQSVSFRDKPSTSGTTYRYLKTGETVTAAAMLNPSWYQVRDAQGVTGYVSSSASYIQVLSNAKALKSLNFRSQPSASSTLLRTVTTGEELYVIEKMNSSYYRARDASGVTGYVTTDAAYLSTNFSVTGVLLPLSERIEAIIAEGKEYLGTPYEFGSTRYNNTTFDCSDFTQMAFWQGARTVLPGDSQAQGDQIRAADRDVTDWRQLKRGDLMFYMSYKGSSAGSYSTVNRAVEPITHVGIYLGDGQMLHTYSVASGGVRIDSIAGSQWENRFLFGGSVY